MPLQANAGDRLVVRGHKAAEADREGEILEVRGPGGAPPYVVRWSDGHEGLLFPGVDAYVRPAADQTG